MPADALFLPDGDGTYVPTAAAVGPWDAGIVHGAAVVALLAGRLTPAEGTMARVTVDFLRPVPMGPLDLALTDLGGGSRAQRRRAVLARQGREVAAAEAVVLRPGELDLPERARAHPTPFDPAAAPPLDEPNRAAAEIVGHESYDSESVVFVALRVEGDRRVHAWISLVLPVVAGTELQGTEVAAAAADYGQSAVSRQLPFAEWSFRNTEQTIHLARAPVGPWVGLRSEALVQPVGAGFSSADLFDAGGWVGRSTAAIVVERRG
ncbi:MAG: thioesterase family protein [Acidimicrobiales bacterium]|nr:thioesterase family protein [Acidimicrobiales bacterium]